jgi:hypothetical protein
MKGILLREGPLCVLEKVEVEDTSYQAIAKVIGPKCKGIERVKIGDINTRKPFDAIMLVNDEGVYDDGLKVNVAASLLYGWTIHRGHVVGNAVLLSEEPHEEGGVTFCELHELDLVLWSKRIEANI